MEYKYKCLQVNKLSVDTFSISPVTWRDIFFIMDIRNKQLPTLRQNHYLTEQEQIDYYQFDVLNPMLCLDKPDKILFSLFCYSHIIGYGGLTNISWEDYRAEVSFLVDPDMFPNMSNKYYKAFTKFLTMIKEIAFCQLHFNKIYTETYDFRKSHIGILEECGFKEEGILREHTYKGDGSYIDSIIHGLTRKDYYGSER